jgi:microcystin-dependent protein
MASPFIAEIRMAGWNFAPKGWAMCNGQLLAISQNTALFSLLGTFYGGDGKSTFGLPDFQDSTPMCQGQGAGLSPRSIGEAAGSQTVTLVQAEMPAHPHQVWAYTGDPADSRDPAPNKSLGTPSPGNLYNPTATGLNPMALQALGVTGGGLPHNNLMPYLVVTFCIALQGIFPPRG